MENPLIDSIYLQKWNDYKNAKLVAYPATENGLKWIQIFRNIDSRMLKWMFFNLECFFIHL